MDKFIETEEKKEKLRAEASDKLIKAKKKKETANQPKLSFDKSGKLSLNFQHDKAMQERWDKAVVLYISSLQHSAWVALMLP